MRSVPFFLVAILCLVAPATRGQTSKTTPSAKSSLSPQPSAAPSGSRPEFRPAVFASGPDSLVNRIDVNALLSKNQQSGGVQFTAVINKDGTTREFVTYRPIQNSDALRNEVEAQLPYAKFAPAIYHHEPVIVMLYGTVLFSPTETPHLHIILNQDPKEIENASDFIGPQPVIGGDSLFEGFHPPAGIPITLTGIVSVALRVDEKGALQNVSVLNEDPPLIGLATCALHDFNGAKFIPAFRDGDPTQSESVLFVAYQTPGEGAPSSLELNPTAPAEPQQ